jgi:hypothetical protein
MRVNVYAEEMTDRVEIISKEIDGHAFTGLRFYLELPCTIPDARPGEIAAPAPNLGHATRNVRGPFIHRPGDDDSAAVTFWGKRDLREVLTQGARDARRALRVAPGRAEQGDRTMSNLPHRRWTMDLKIGADSEQELVRALEQIALDFDRGGLRSRFASGGPASGWSGETSEDPEMTHDRYFEAVEEWKAAQSKEDAT